MLDTIVYGDGWATTDAGGRRFTLYGPYAWLMTPAERRDFTTREFAAMRRRTRSVGSDIARLVGVIAGLAFVVLCMAGLVRLAMLSPGTKWVGTLFLFLVLGVAGVHIVLGIPVDPSRFRRAMLLERRCPHCAQRLEFPAADRVATCAECGAGWRPEKERPRAARPSAPEWKATDARGEKIDLFNAPALVRVAAQRMELSPRELRRLQAESSKVSRLQRVGMATSSGVFGLQALMRTVDQVVDNRPLLACMCGLATLACAVGFWASFRLATGLDPEMFKAAMLRRARCPRCAYRLDASVPDAEDVARLCPECGSSWRLPDHPPTA
jgi:DNA-directed RNA polymerase subunit RPC12/RpoP